MAGNVPKWPLSTYRLEPEAIDAILPPVPLASVPFCKFSVPPDAVPNAADNVTPAELLIVTYAPEVVVVGKLAPVVCATIPSYT